MSTRSALELDEETMQRLGHQVVDLLAGHLAHVRNEPVQHPLSRAEAHERVALPAPAPEQGRSLDDIIAFLRDRVFPYHAREPHPRFMGYVPSTPTYPALLGDWMATGYNFFAGVASVAAGPNEVELTVLEWFRRWLGMPDGARGLLTTGGSNATLTALVAARHAAVGDRSEVLSRLVMYCSDQAHSSVARAAWIAGIPRTNVRELPTDEHFRLRVDALGAAVDRDRADGLQPFLVVGNAGATNTGAVDPLHELADFARREKLWFHVDAAYAGFAVLTVRGRDLLSGIERADSITLDPHKWLYVPFECGCLMVREPAKLRDAFRVTADYLKDVEGSDEEINFADYGEQLTRYARAFKIWVSVNYFGLSAIRDAIDGCMRVADHAERRVQAAPDLEVLSPAQFGIVCFRVHPAGMDDPAALDALNERVNAAANATQQVLMSSTRLHGTLALRFCILNYRTTEADIDAVIELVRRCAAAEAEAG